MEAHKKLRQAIKDAGNKPAIPHLGVFLSSFVLLEEWPDHIDGRIHFKKQYGFRVSTAIACDCSDLARSYMAGRIIDQLRRYQLNAFSFEPVPEVQAYVTNYESLVSPSVLCILGHFRSARWRSSIIFSAAQSCAVC
jgi:hypothetical protein